MNAQEIIDYIANSEKKTPVKVYVNTTGPVDFGSAKVFGSNGSYTVFGDWAELSPVLERNSGKIADLVVENDRRNSGVPLLDTRGVTARIEPGSIIREKVEIGEGAVVMNTHINNHLALGNASAVHGPGLSGGHNQHVRLLALLRQIPRVGMADGNGGVPRQQQHCHRFSDHQTPSHHNDLPPIQTAVVVVQNLHARLCGAGRIPRSLSRKHAGQRSAGDAVHILFGAQCLAGRMAKATASLPESLSRMPIFLVPPYFSSLTIVMAPKGHALAQMPQPLQKK